MKRIFASALIIFSAFFAVVTPTFAISGTPPSPVTTKTPVLIDCEQMSGDNDYIVFDNSGNPLVMQESVHNGTPYTVDCDHPEDENAYWGGTGGTYHVVVFDTADLSDEDAAMQTFSSIQGETGYLGNIAYTVTLPPAPQPNASVISNLVGSQGAIMGMKTSTVNGLALLIPLGAILLISIAVVFFMIKKFRAVVRN